MNVIISTKRSRDNQKTWYYIEWGKAKGQRNATGIYTWCNPKDKLQRSFNQAQLQIVEHKRSVKLVELNRAEAGIKQVVRISNIIPFYQQYVKENERAESRHLKRSLHLFIDQFGSEVHPSEVTEELCKRFRRFLLDTYKGETPANYFSEFKNMLKSAVKAGYFSSNPASEIPSVSNPKTPKDILTAEEYISILQYPCSNLEVRRAFLFCLYTGMAWVDVKNLKHEMLRDDGMLIYPRKKSGTPAVVPLHETAKMIAGSGKGLVFDLPSANGANKALKEWIKVSGINKHITWHSARHSMSVALQSSGVSLQVVAGILGHTTTKYVMSTYQRYIHTDARAAILNLPS